MPTQQDLPRVPHDVKFRVLIIGRANAGMTSILQRVCDTTESPEINRLVQRPMVMREKPEKVVLSPSMERSQHDIEDELIFTNHDGYVFHDSRGLESGSEDELKIVQDFVKRKSQERRLNDRLHVIWYCVPMDNDRPSLDLKYFEYICPDKNVPLIAVFTKYDQFKRDVLMKLEDQDRDPMQLDDEAKKIFDEHYLANLRGSPPFVCLENMHKPGQRCTDLIEKTANALSDNVVALMLLAVQKDNLELNIGQAVRWAHSAFERGSGDIEKIIKICIQAFPPIWYIEETRRFLESIRDSPLKRELESEFGAEPLWSILRPCVADPPLSIHQGDAHHALIAMTVILEHACLLFTSRHSLTRDEAVHIAYNRYTSLGFHNEVATHFSASPAQYTILQFTEFILKHRL